MPEEYPKFTAAAIQVAPEYRDKPIYFDSVATLNNALGHIKEAASNGATLIVFPELHIPGYCHFAIDLTRGPEYTGIWAEYLRHGIEVPSKETDLIRQFLTMSRTGDGFLMEAHPKLKPVDSPTKGVYIAGCAESPKDVKDSVTQASAAAARAEILLNAPQIKAEAITAVVDEDLCNSCEACVPRCQVSAIKMNDSDIAQIDYERCLGCGVCISICAPASPRPLRCPPVRCGWLRLGSPRACGAGIRRTRGAAAAHRHAGRGARRCPRGDRQADGRENVGSSR